MGPICCPETSVGKYNYMVRNSPEQRSSRFCQLLRLYGVVDIRMNMEHFWIYTDKGRPKYSYKNFSHASLSNTNPTWIGLGLKWASAARGQRLTGLAIRRTWSRSSISSVSGNVDWIRVYRDAVQWIRFRNFGLYKSRISVSRSLTNSFACCTYIHYFDAV